MNTIQFNLIRIANELKNSIDAIFTFDKSAQINETLGNYCAEKDWLVWATRSYISRLKAEFKIHFLKKNYDEIRSIAPNTKLSESPRNEKRNENKK